MKIAILTIGSEGDVRPYLALGQELAKQHDIYLVTHGSAKTRVEQAGLHFRDIGKDPVVDLQTSDLGQAVEAAGALGKLSATKAWFASLVEDWFAKAHAALTDIQPDFCVLGTFPMNVHSLLCSHVLKTGMASSLARGPEVPGF